MLWATESSDKFIIPAFQSFREDSQSAPSTHPDQPLGANGAIEMARKAILKLGPLGKQRGPLCELKPPLPLESYEVKVGLMGFMTGRWSNFFWVQPI